MASKDEAVALTLMLMLATPAYTVSLDLTALAGLQRCWRVSGQVQGEDLPSIARGEWRLGRRYFTLHLHDRARPISSSDHLWHRRAAPCHRMGSVFSDTFEPPPRLGDLEPGGFVQRYSFSDATYLNRFSRSGTGWHWTITEQPKDKSSTVFADYNL